MKKLLDLRFVIGLFFALIGLFLLIYDLGFAGRSDNKGVNFYSSIVFLAFGAFMIVLSYLSVEKE